MPLSKDGKLTTRAPRHAVTETATEARQGFSGRPVLMVLIGGLTLALLAWGLAEFYGETVDSDNATETQAPAAAGGQDPATDQQVIDNTPPEGEAMQPAPTDRDPTPQSGTGGESQTVSPSGTEKVQ